MDAHVRAQAVDVDLVVGDDGLDQGSVTVTCEMLEDLKSNMDRMLSPLEMSVWRKRMAGKTNAQIAQTPIVNLAFGRVW